MGETRNDTGTVHLEEEWRRAVSRRFGSYGSIKDETSHPPFWATAEWGQLSSRPPGEDRNTPSTPPYGRVEEGVVPLTSTSSTGMAAVDKRFVGGRSEIHDLPL